MFSRRAIATWALSAFALTAAACSETLDAEIADGGSHEGHDREEDAMPDDREEDAMPDGSTDGAGGSAPDTATDGTGGPENDGSDDADPPSDASACRPAGTLGVFTSGDAAYRIDGINNPSLRLCRGFTYTFALSVSGHPFSIQTEDGVDYDTGVTGNGQSSGDLVFVVSESAPDRLRYICGIHPKMTGAIFIAN